MSKYILDENNNPIVEPDVLKWGKWFEKAERHIGLDTIGEVKVSTVFLGLDYNWGLNGSPVLWETMIFGGKHDEYQERYSSYSKALKGHQDAVELVKNDNV